MYVSTHPIGKLYTTSLVVFLPPIYVTKAKREEVKLVGFLTLFVEDNFGKWKMI